MNQFSVMFEISLSKESFKFSSSHFTIFDETRAEPLHGHNYYVSVTLRFHDWDKQTAMAHDFSTLKKEIQTLCDSLDEKVLIALESSFIKTQKEEDGLWVYFAKKRYFFPSEDLVELPTTNITCEALAYYLCQKLCQNLSAIKNLTSVKVTTQETRGQSASNTQKITQHITDTSKSNTTKGSTPC